MILSAFLEINISVYRPESIIVWPFSRSTYLNSVLFRFVLFALIVCRFTKSLKKRSVTNGSNQRKENGSIECHVFRVSRGGQAQIYNPGKTSELYQKDINFEKMKIFYFFAAVSGKEFHPYPDANPTQISPLRIKP